MLSSIIFSKDRPLQLDLTLNTLEKNFPQCSNIVVLYKATNENFHRGYQDLIKESSNNRFFKNQGDSFFNDCLDALSVFRNASYHCLLTDDIIFYDKVNTTKDHLDILFRDPQLACFSLRLGINIRMRDYMGEGTMLPDIVPQHFNRVNEHHITWNRTSIPIGGYWSSPLCVDGHIFRHKDLWDMWYTMYEWPETETKVKSPNNLESYMHRFFFEFPTIMACEKTSKIVNSPNNRVQNTHKNSFGVEYNYDSEYLNKLFLDGYRIRDLNIDKGSIVCPHQEIDILKGLRK